MDDEENLGHFDVTQPDEEIFGRTNCSEKMITRALLVISSVIVLLLLEVYARNNNNQKTSMVWMCLERCQESKSEILANLQTIQTVAHRSLTAVSFELYNIGANSSLIKNNDLSNVAPVLQKVRAFGGEPLKLYPMISSYPYPKELIDWMRYLFKNPQPFIEAALREVDHNAYDGFNLDLEPVTGVTTQDAADYARFIGLFAQALHSRGKNLNVDTAAWSILWDYGLISKSLSAESGDIMITMGTYTQKNTTWLQQLQKVVSESDSLQKVGIGLMPCMNDDTTPLPIEDVNFRFNNIKQYGVQNVEVWTMKQVWLGDRSIWWDKLEQFLLNN